MENVNKATVSTYAVMIVLTIVGLLIVNILDIRYPFSIVTSSRSSELAVTGEGKIDVTPDTAYIDVGINVSNVPTVQEAEKKINEINNKIIDAMKKIGIKKEDIKTSNYSIYPNSVYEGGRDRINGYNGNVTITIKTNKTSLVPQVITGATGAGANQVQGVRFSVDRPDIYREKARDEAIANAREQAKKLAKTLSIRLGNVTNIQESAPGNIILPYQAMRADSAIGGGAPAPEIEPGTQTISSTVTLYFEKR